MRCMKYGVFVLAVATALVFGGCGNGKADPASEAPPPAQAEPEQDGGSEIYREGNQRYVAIKYSVRGRDLGSAVEEAMKKVNAQVQLPRGYHIDWEGEYESEKRAESRLFVIVPLTVLLIFMIFYTMFRSFKWAALILANVALARIGVSVQTGSSCSNISTSSAREATR
jgi:cobalt-zinc-cadmium resistance protein CzcA